MQKHYGFTLIELSIVLVIIGLIIAGITSGVNVLRDSSLKRAMSDAENYRGTLALFKNRYKSLPGDFSRAGTIWGNDCQGSTTGSDTCSGNGNRRIQHGGEDNLTATSESLRLWQHLANAEMIPYKLTGLPATGCADPDNICAATGQNIPEATIKNSGVYFYTNPTTQDTALIFGGTDSTSWNSLPILSPLEAYEIDNKLDDGVNNTGKFFGTGLIDGSGGWTLSFNDATTNCYNASTSTRYNTATDDSTCGAVFIMGKNF